MGREMSSVPDSVQAMNESSAVLADPPLDPAVPVASPDRALEAELTGDAADLAAAVYRWLVRLAAYDRSGGWAWWGCRSAAHWLAWHCGVDLPTAREQVKVAHRLAELPLVAGALARGEVSWSQVRLMARVATPGRVEEGLLGCARQGTTAQLARIVGGLRRVLDAQAAEAGSLHRRRSLRWWFDDDGFLVVTGRLAPDAGAVVAKALQALVDDLVAGKRQRVRETLAPVAPSPEEAPGVADDAWGATRADALVRMARLALAAADNPIRDRARVVVHVDAAVLAHRGPGAEDHAEPAGLCEVEDGPAISRQTVLRLACDAAVVALVEGPGGAPLDVGRATRSIPPAIRRALRARDGGCRFPGCGERRFVEAHHLRHWAHGGPTALSNLVALCPFHHRLHHEEGYHLEGTPTACASSAPTGW